MVYTAGWVAQVLWTTDTLFFHTLAQVLRLLYTPGSLTDSTCPPVRLPLIWRTPQHATTGTGSSHRRWAH